MKKLPWTIVVLLLAVSPAGAQTFPGTRKPYLPRRLYNMGIDRVEPHRSYTGLIYLERSAKMHPFVWEPCE